MDESILNSIKKMLGIDSDYDAFDVDIIAHINSAFFTLNQLGHNSRGFTLTDDKAVWGDYVDSPETLNVIKSYISAKVRLAFDPPSTSFGIEALKKQIEEWEWRINVYLDPIEQTPIILE